MNFIVLPIYDNFEKTLDYFLQYIQDDIDWEKYAGPGGNRTNVDIDYLLTIPEFSKLEDHLNSKNISIYQAIFRRSPADVFLGIHTDDIIDPDGDRISVSLSLNIPISNGNGGITRWYNFENNMLDEELVQSQQTPGNKFRDARKQRSYFLNFCVESKELSEPMIVRTDIPHNLDSKIYSSDKDRFILTIRLIKFDKKQIVQWSDAEQVLEAFA